MAVAGIILWVPAAPAEDTAGTCKNTELGTVTLQHENDLFAGTDRHYTSGLRFSWLSPEGCKTIKPLRVVQDFLEGLAPAYDRDRTRFGWALGQDIFTPKDRFRTDLIG